jgi:AraC-like DNA-binding protein/mannose-6-phosphate isomerase-like protein (cupin superfamily)
MPHSTETAQKTARNPHLTGAVRFSPLELAPEFPLDIVLDGVRDDAPITQMHIHDAFELGYCLSGSGTFYVGAKILPFREGDITLLTDREFHRCRSSPGTSSRWAWVFFEPTRLLVPHTAPFICWEPARFCGPRFSNVVRPAQFPRLADLVRHLLAEARSWDSFTRTNLRALLLLIVNELHRTYPRFKGGARPDLSAQALARIAPALHRVASGFQDVLTVPELARDCGMSLRSFQQHFIRLIGHTPQQHLLNSRVNAVAALLTNREKAISDIAYRCGFNTLSSFNRAFRAFYRMSPRDYRRRIGQPQGGGETVGQSGGPQNRGTLAHQEKAAGRRARRKRIS